MSQDLKNRIIELKKQKLSWNEIAKQTGLTYNAVRGIYRRSNRENFQFRTINTNESIMIDEDVEELIQKDKNQHLQSSGYETLRKKYSALLRRDNIADRIINEVKPLLVNPPIFPELYNNISQSQFDNQDALLLMSCLHFGEVVEPESIMGLGEYNARIAASRFQYYIENSINVLKNHHENSIDKVWFVCVGDVVSGDIHQELIATNEFPLGEQIVRAAYLLAYGIADLAAHFKEVEFIGLVGNHGRFEKKPYFKSKYNNADWVVYHMAKTLLSNQKNITMTIPKSPWHTTKIKGHNFFFSHGDQIRASNGVPFADMKKFIGEMSQLLVKAGEEFPEYWGFGHWHQEASLQVNHGEILMPGSFKGADEYVVNKIRAGTSAMQLLAGVQEDKGISFRYPIHLEDVNTIEYDRYQAVSEKEWNF